MVVLHASLARSNLNAHARRVHLARIDTALADSFLGRPHGELHCAAHEFVVLGEAQEGFQLERGYGGQGLRCMALHGKGSGRSDAGFAQAAAGHVLRRRKPERRYQTHTCNRDALHVPAEILQYCALSSRRLYASKKGSPKPGSL